MPCIIDFDRHQSNIMIQKRLTTLSHERKDFIKQKQQNWKSKKFQAVSYFLFHSGVPYLCLSRLVTNEDSEA